jgi:uncharacterized protein (TIGR04255 family)
MSKLPNAPLLEVVFELRWQIKQKSDLTKYQYLVGDLYSQIKDKYPYRENLTPPEIPIDFLVNNPVHRFRVEKNKYPLVQVGPGVITLNTTEEYYYWEDFYQSAESLTNSFFNVYPIDTESFKPNLSYFDFFKINFKENNVNDFVNSFLNLTHSQDFIEINTNPFDLDVGFFYLIDLGKLSVTLKKGQNSQSEEGIVMQMSLIGEKSSTNNENLLTWLGSAHSFLSDLFKKITHGELYNSFK